MDIVKEIANGLIDYTKNNKKFEVHKDKFVLKSHQKVRIEDLLQIFVDDLELQKEFLKFIIEEVGNHHSKEIEQLTTINLHHRLLEYYLYSKQMNEKKNLMNNLQTDNKSFIAQIQQFIGNHDQKIDKNYILFLF